MTEITAQSIDEALRKQLDAINTSVESRETGVVVQRETKLDVGGHEFQDLDQLVANLNDSISPAHVMSALECSVSIGCNNFIDDVTIRHLDYLPLSRSAR